MAPLSPIIRGLGDIGPTPVQRIAPNIRLIPGDLSLSNFESNLSEAWGDCLDGKEPAFRKTSSLYRITRQSAEEFEADLVLIDVRPNFGAIGAHTNSVKDCGQDFRRLAISIEKALHVPAGASSDQTERQFT